MSNDVKRIVHHLPGTRLSPEVVLHRTLEKLPRIKAVALVIMWDDDTYSSDWSQMKTSELTTAARVLGITADRELIKTEEN